MSYNGYWQPADGGGSFATCIADATIPTDRYNTPSMTTKRPFAGGKKRPDHMISPTLLPTHCRLFAGYTP